MLQKISFIVLTAGAAVFIKKNNHEKNEDVSLLKTQITNTKKEVPKKIFLFNPKQKENNRKKTHEKKLGHETDIFIQTDEVNEQLFLLDHLTEENSEERVVQLMQKGYTNHKIKKMTNLSKAHIKTLRKKYRNLTN